MSPRDYAYALQPIACDALLSTPATSMFKLAVEEVRTVRRLVVFIPCTYSTCDVPGSEAFLLHHAARTILGGTQLPAGLFSSSAILKLPLLLATL